jgi:hypothetical protein
MSKPVPARRSRPAPASRLRNATVFFHTNNDDKDHDTHVTVTVKDGKNRMVARIDNDFGGFPDNSDRGPYGLSVRNPSSFSDLETGNVVVRVDPNGHDTWRFNVDVDLFFDDGTHLGGHMQDMWLDQNKRELSFPIEGFNTR